MLEDKIKELRNYGYSIDEIVKIVLEYHNKNPYGIWNFERLCYDDMKSFVILTLVKVS